MIDESTPAGTQYYDVATRRHGLVTIPADSLEDAKVRARRLFGRGFTGAAAAHVDCHTCDFCGCTPCECPKVSRSGGAR